MANGLINKQIKREIQKQTNRDETTLIINF
jgi:hypothetical protein